jgi:hypothetical protein
MAPEFNRKHHTVGMAPESNTGAIPTVWYFLLDSGGIPTVWYFLLNSGAII